MLCCRFANYSYEEMGDRKKKKINGPGVCTRHRYARATSSMCNVQSKSLSIGSITSRGTATPESVQIAKPAGGRKKGVVVEVVCDTLLLSTLLVSGVAFVSSSVLAGRPDPPDPPNLRPAVDATRPSHSVALDATRLATLILKPLFFVNKLITSFKI